MHRHNAINLRKITNDNMNFLTFQRTATTLLVSACQHLWQTGAFPAGSGAEPQLQILSGGCKKLFYFCWIQSETKANALVHSLWSFFFKFYFGCCFNLVLSLYLITGWTVEYTVHTHGAIHRYNRCYSCCDDLLQQQPATVVLSHCVFVFTV